MKPFFSLTFEQLAQWLAERKLPAFHAGQLFEWVYRKRVLSFAEMTNLSKGLRQTMQESFALPVLKLGRQVASDDGETTKFLWELLDGKFVESVLICAPDRRTVCVSSQVGCPARCAFCASGKEGLVRNLSSAEIVEQVVQIQKMSEEPVTHVVFMGMGEPLENYDEVVEALRALSDAKKVGISPRRITVSTVGVLDKIYKLAEEDLNVHLVLSLHAPDQNLRKKIIPYARKYELTELLTAMDHFSHVTKRDISFEYTLMAGINDGVQHAKALVQLLKGKQCTLNLIPYNPVAGLRLHRPEGVAIEQFRDILIDAGVRTTWRYTKGKDIAAACGQLALQKNISPV